MFGLHLVEQTPTYLRFASDKISLRNIMIQIALGSFAISGILFQFAGSQITLKCRRSTPKDVQCELTTVRLLTRDSMAIFNLKGAEVENNDDTDRLVLLTGAGKVPFDPVYTNFNRSKKGNDAYAIDRFVEDPQQANLTIQDDSRLLSVIFGGLMLWFGIYSLLAQFQTECRFDRATSQLSLSKANVFWSKVHQHSLQEIKGIRLIETTDSDGDKSYMTQIVWRSNEHFNLALLDPKLNPRDVVEILQTFLGVPLEFEQVKK